MFVFRVSYMSMLREIAQHCCLAYISTIHEIIYGIELELPALLCRADSRCLFYSAPQGVDSQLAYEAAALQALIALQTIYGFVAQDYILHGLVLYRTLAQRLLPLANRGIQLARLLIMAGHDGYQDNAHDLA